jgi:hypothetical protein
MGLTPPASRISTPTLPIRGWSTFCYPIGVDFNTFARRHKVIPYDGCVIK